MLQEAIDAVRAFKIEKNVLLADRLKATPNDLEKLTPLRHVVTSLDDCSRRLLFIYQAMERHYSKDYKLSFVGRATNVSQEPPDHRLICISMLLEECRELIVGMMTGDEVETVDALADIEYVAKGIAITFDLPLSEVFEEVHRSNMTKAPSVKGARLKDKGPNYKPPRIAEIIRKHREHELV